MSVCVVASLTNVCADALRLAGFALGGDVVSKLAVCTILDHSQVLDHSHHPRPQPRRPGLRLLFYFAIQKVEFEKLFHAAI